MLITAGVLGFNVTVPHKEKAETLYWSATAEKIGAANTLVIDVNGKINADNTDGYGFITNLRSHCKHWVPAGGPCLGFGRWRRFTRYTCVLIRCKLEKFI